MFGRGAHGEFVEVRFAKRNGAGAAKSLNDGGVVRRAVVSENFRATGAGWPATLMMSLIAIGTPPSGRLTSARCGFLSRAIRHLAKGRRRFSRRPARIRSISASSASRGETSFRRRSRWRSRWRAPSIRRRSFNNLWNDEKVFALARRVAQRFLGVEPVARLVGPQFVRRLRGVESIDRARDLA